MFGLGTPEIIVILLVIVLLFGARKIPELMRGLGSGIKEFKKASILDDDEPIIDSKKKSDKNDDRVSAPAMSRSEALEVLGLAGTNPDFEDVRRSYKERIAEYHPDKTSHLGKELQELAVKKTVQINSAYEVLSRKFDI